MFKKKQNTISKELDKEVDDMVFSDSDSATTDQELDDVTRINIAYMAQ